MVGAHQCLHFILCNSVFQKVFSELLSFFACPLLVFPFGNNLGQTLDLGGDQFVHLLLLALLVCLRYPLLLHLYRLQLLLFCTLTLSPLSFLPGRLNRIFVIHPVEVGGRLIVRVQLLSQCTKKLGVLLSLEYYSIAGLFKSLLFFRKCLTLLRIICLT